ncbi:MAG: proline dehydrogenase family protein, partial [Bacteroidota bacterium]
AAKAAQGASKQSSALDFQNTRIAFEHKTNQELQKMAWLFSLMNKPWLVNVGTRLGLKAVQWKLPFAEPAVRKTIFEQFCGGRTLLESQVAIDKLWSHEVLTVLDYGVEAKSKEEDFNITMNEIIRGIEFAATNASVPVVSAKLTGLARFALLEAVSAKRQLNKTQQQAYKNVLKRLDSICHVAREKQVAIFFDAEESWIQAAIDDLVLQMMARYNTEKAVVYNTYQMYRWDRLAFLKKNYKQAQQGNYLLGAKLVRGAYMEKERKRAKENGYKSPIQVNKAATDKDFDKAVRFCVERYKTIASCNASHNAASNRLQAKLIASKKLPRAHAHLNFCQLYGMSDHLTFNLAKAGYNVAKYLVYGPVRDVLPYLVRRAEENTSITGDMSREYDLVMQEMKRRGLA